MSEPVNVPPVTPPATSETTAITELLGKLNESVQNLDDRLNGIEEQVQAVANPPLPPAPIEPEPEWKPKTWDEFPKLAEEVAKKTFQQIEDEKIKRDNDLVAQQKVLQEQIDADFDEQLTKLEKEGAIPPVGKMDDPNDAGKLARKELFAIGIKYGTPDLVAIAAMRNDQMAAGYTFNIEEKKWIKSNPSPFGAGAPVGSSSKTASVVGKPTYAEIHGLSMDEMVRRANT